MVRNTCTSSPRIRPGSAVCKVSVWSEKSRQKGVRFPTMWVHLLALGSHTAIPFGTNQPPRELVPVTERATLLISRLLTRSPQSCELDQLEFGSFVSTIVWVVQSRPLWGPRNCNPRPRVCVINMYISPFSLALVLQ